MNLELARHNMVQRQLRGSSVLDARTLDVISELPREDFIPASHRTLAYADIPTPLPCGQHTMTPREEGLLLQALELQPDEHVLEIGTGCGFLSACISRMAAQVDSLEVHQELATPAADALRKFGCDNVSVHTGDVWRYHNSGVHYDALIFTASLPQYTTRFERWLKPGGRLFVVLGSAPVMTAQLRFPGDAQSLQAQSLFELNLAPLLGCPA